ncbi:DUF58 domain-containing protein [Cryobacterium frigoriphilum]|uniref:DUF58 domain-containing protein n=1 Tax=Cryobacterium frigoriphilum TaxID=1259150 RepID=A0A4R9AB34_9MICO|nr:DUF58 domain-containing protein [Cryobacterium frigoriphilum]TFD55280.1 DUF58 domain-containing protein [Cryobacterium frigoriphilum]
MTSTLPGTTTPDDPSVTPAAPAASATPAALGGRYVASALVPGRFAQLRYALTSVGRALRAASGALWRLLLIGLRTAARFARPVTDVVGPAGWLTLVAAVVAFSISRAFGWVEFTYLATTLLAALLVAVVFIFGRATYQVSIALNPHRVVAGQRALGEMIVTNTGAKGLLPARMELPVGEGLAEFVIPGLAAQGVHDELFAVPTHRRAVVVAGPAISVRGDQLGLLRRTVRWTDPVELFVHPVTTRLASSAAGLVRDLEGEITKKITNSDISFHALRAYVPGDALRNVHWRTSARTGQLMVRQFEETRRSQLTIIHTLESVAYASDEEFELGVSVMASLALQVIREKTNMSVVTEERQLVTGTPLTLLDDSSRIDPVEDRYPTLRDFARDATRRLPAPSVVMIIAGSQTELLQYRTVQNLFGPDTKTLAFRIEAGAQSRLSKVSGLTVITLGQLGDLPSILRRANG